MSFPPFTSQKPSEIPIFGFKFREIFNFDLCFTENRLFWGLAMFMTSLWRHTLDVWTYFGMYGMRRPVAIIWYHSDILGGVQFSRFTGSGNNPTWKPRYRKRLGKTKVKIIFFILIALQFWEFSRTCRTWSNMVKNKAYGRVRHVGVRWLVKVYYAIAHCCQRDSYR